MKLINREQIAGMNIHYLFYSLDYFLDKQAELGFKTIELWGGDIRMRRKFGKRLNLEDFR